MRTATTASILSKIVAVHLLSLLASSEVSDAHGISSKLTNNNCWNLKRVIIRKNGTTTEDAADVYYLEQTCGCSLERHEFYLDVPCDGNSSLESSELLCPQNVRLIYQLGSSKSLANSIETDRPAALTFLRNIIWDEHKDVTILALLLILLVALTAITILACMYCRAASKLAGGALESQVIHYAAENVRSFAGAVSETSNEIRVLEISEPITDTIVRSEEKHEMPTTPANQSTASSDIMY